MNKFNISELNKLYYTIGEVADLFTVNSSLIRFWEKEFDFQASKKNKKGNRLYTVKDIEKLMIIFDLVKVQGFTLEGAKNQLKSKKSLHIGATEQVAPSNGLSTVVEKQPISVKPDVLISRNTVEIIQHLEKIKNQLIELKF